MSFSNALKNRLNQKLATISRTIGTTLQGMYQLTQLKIEHFDGTNNTGNVLLDNCEALNIDTFDTDTIFKAVLDETFAVKGDASIKLQSLTTAAIGDHKAYNTITSEDWTGTTHILLAVRPDRSLDAGDVQLYIKDTSAGDQYVNLPALTSGVTEWIEVSLSGKTITAITRYGFKRNVAELFNLNIDAIYRIGSTMLKTLSEEPVNVVEFSSILKANTGTHERTDLVEDTDYVLATDTKHVIFLTDQSTKTMRMEYTY